MDKMDKMGGMQVEMVFSLLLTKRGKQDQIPKLCQGQARMG